jgi:hypothetical protein
MHRLGEEASRVSSRRRCRRPRRQGRAGLEGSFGGAGGAPTVEVVAADQGAARRASRRSDAKSCDYHGYEMGEDPG